jgi:hypothetical protein
MEDCKEPKESGRTEESREKEKEREEEKGKEDEEKQKVVTLSMDTAQNMAQLETMRHLEPGAPCAPVYDPMSAMQRGLQISERDQLYHTREQKMGTENIGIDLSGSEGSSRQQYHFVYACAGSDYSVPEEFAGFAMCQYIKHLAYQVLIDELKPEEELLKKCMELINDKYFIYEEKRPRTTRKFFCDLEQERKEQLGRISGFQQFMGEFADFKKMYERLLKAYGTSKGIYCPLPAIFSILYCNKSKQATMKRYEGLKKDTGIPLADGKPVFRMYAVGRTRQVLPFNPCANQKNPVEFSDAHVQALYDNIQRNMQLRSQRYVNKEQESIDKHISPPT